MTELDISIWGRNFKLPVVFKTYINGETTDLQKEAFERFQQNSGIVDSAKQSVEAYVMQNEQWQAGDNANNVFRYVVPRCIVIPRRKERVVGVLCHFRFDIEHGLAIVFENEKLKEIDMEDVVL